MTTISSNRRRKRISPGTGLSVIFLAFLLLCGFLWKDAIASIVWRGLLPVFSAREQSARAAEGFFGQFAPGASLASENMRLRAALASSSIAVMDRNLLYAENQDLKARLGRTVASSTVIAAVVLRPPAVPYDTLMLDVGRNRGVRAGDFVSAEGSVFIGKVSEVYDTASRVVLFSAPGQNYQALLRGSMPVSVAGQGGGSLAGELPIGVEVRTGDQVILPSIRTEYAARVTGVLHHEGESFQTIFLSLPVNMLSLRFVHVHSDK